MCRHCGFAGLLLSPARPPRRMSGKQPDAHAIARQNIPADDAQAAEPTATKKRASNQKWASLESLRCLSQVCPGGPWPDLQGSYAALEELSSENGARGCPAGE